MADRFDMVDRCVLTWEPEMYYWCSPGDRDEWLEVDPASYYFAEAQPAKFAEQLRIALRSTDCPCGKKHDHGHTFPLRARRAWLKQQGAAHDGAMFDTVGE